MNSELAHLAATENTTGESLKCIELGSALTIAETEEVHKRMCSAFDGGAAEVEVDVSQVESADTAGVQLLLAFAREAGSRSRTVHWREPSEPLLKAAALLALDQTLFGSPAA